MASVHAGARDNGRKQAKMRQGWLFLQKSDPTLPQHRQPGPATTLFSEIAAFERCFFAPSWARSGRSLARRSGRGGYGRPVWRRYAKTDATVQRRDTGGVALGG